MVKNMVLVSIIFRMARTMLESGKIVTEMVMEYIPLKTVVKRQAFLKRISFLVIVTMDNMRPLYI